jgi:hypothetical protein
VDLQVHNSISATYETDFTASARKGRICADDVTDSHRSQDKRKSLILTSANGNLCLQQGLRHANTAEIDAHNERREASRAGNKRIVAPFRRMAVERMSEKISFHARVNIRRERALFPCMPMSLCICPTQFTLKHFPFNLADPGAVASFAINDLTRAAMIPILSNNSWALRNGT